MEILYFILEHFFMYHYINRQFIYDLYYLAIRRGIGDLEIGVKAMFCSSR